MIAKDIKEQLGRSSEIRKMFEEGVRLRAIRGADNVFDFSLGNPDTPTPEPVTRALKDLVLSETDHGYMANAGFPATRSKVATLETRRNNTTFTEQGIVMTCGAAAALNIALASILDPGDEVIVLSPYFAEYLSYIRNYHGQAIVVPALNSGQMDLERLERAITPRTKAMIINSPNNPSGTVYPRQDLEVLSEILRKQEQTIYLIADEPYREIVYDGTTVTGLAGLYSETLVCYSWSKSFSLAGERIGYVAVADACEGFQELMQALVLQNRVRGFVNAPSLWQRVVDLAIDAPTDAMSYLRRRDALIKNLALAGLKIKDVPQGAFYLFPQLPEDTSEAGVYALNALKEQGILAVNGTGFGAPGFLRFAYCVSDEMIERSRPAFAKARVKLVARWPELADQ